MNDNVFSKFDSNQCVENCLLPRKCDNLKLDVILMVKPPCRSDNQQRLTYTSIDTNHNIEELLTHYNNQWRGINKCEICIFHFGFCTSLIMAYSMRKWNTWIDDRKCFRYWMYSCNPNENFCRFFFDPNHNFSRNYHKSYRKCFLELSMAVLWDWITAMSISRLKL